MDYKIKAVYNLNKAEVFKERKRCRRGTGGHGANYDRTFQYIQKESFGYFVVYIIYISSFGFDFQQYDDLSLVD